jgi:SagB-type dehydrogenase family enzyme
MLVNLNSMPPVGDDHALVHLFHSNSNYHRDYSSHIARRQSSAPFKEYLSFPRVPLGGRDGPSSPIERVVAARRSHRRFSDKAIPKEYLQKLVYTTVGTTATMQINEAEHSLRAVPSAGALYPLELYLACYNVEEVEQGLYHYNVQDDVLENIGDKAKLDHLDRAWVRPEFARNAGLVLIFSAVFERTVHKYGARGYRFCLMECGMAAEHVILQATELGLSSLITGGFYDILLDSLLGLDDAEEASLCAVACGYSAE